MARTSESRFRPHQPRYLRPTPGPERVGHQREARKLGPIRRPEGHHGPDTGDRRALRHDGPEAHGGDGGSVAQGRYLYCPEGSHLAMYDDQETYFEGLIRFIKDVDAGRF